MLKKIVFLLEDEGQSKAVEELKKNMGFYNKISLCIERLLKPHKYSVFKAVKSGKKQGNVGNSYFIPAPLLYRYSYILSNCDFAFLHHYNILFYFFYFCFQPIKFSLSINLFCNIRNLMTNHVLDSILIHSVFLCHRYKMFSAVMRSVFRIQI